MPQLDAEMEGLSSLANVIHHHQASSPSSLYADLIAAADAQLEAVRQATHRTVVERETEFNAVWDAGTRLRQNIRDGQKQLADVESALAAPNTGLEPCILARLAAHSDIASSHARSALRLQYLTVTAHLASQLLPLASAPLPEAAHLIPKVQRTWDSAPAWMKETTMVKKLCGSLRERLETTRFALEDVARKGCTQRPGGGLEVRAIAETDRGGVVWFEALSALALLSPKSFDHGVSGLSSIISKWAVDVDKYILQPAFELFPLRDSSEDVELQVKYLVQPQKLDDGQATSLLLNDSVGPIHTLFESLKTIVTEITSILLPQHTTHKDADKSDSDQERDHLVRKGIRKALVARIIANFQKVLQSELPPTVRILRRIKSYSILVKCAAEFPKWLRQSVPALAHDQTDGDDPWKEVLEFVNDVGLRWGAKLQALSLHAARRDIISKCSWEGIVVEWQIEEVPHEQTRQPRSELQQPTLAEIPTTARSSLRNGASPSQQTSPTRTTHFRSLFDFTSSSRDDTPDLPTPIHYSKSILFDTQHRRGDPERRSVDVRREESPADLLRRHNWTPSPPTSPKPIANDPVAVPSTEESNHRLPERLAPRDDEVDWDLTAAASPNPQQKKSPALGGDDNADAWGLDCDEHVDRDEGHQHTSAPVSVPAQSGVHHSSDYLECPQINVPLEKKENRLKSHNLTIPTQSSLPSSAADLNDDPWGLDNDEPTNEMVISPQSKHGSQNPLPKNDEADIEDDPWGLADEDNEDQPDPLRLRGGVGSDDGQDWGWNDDEDNEEVGQQLTNHTEQSTQTVQLSTNGASKGEQWESMTISKAAIQLIDLAKEKISDFETLSSSSWEVSEFSSAAEFLIDTTFNLFHLWRATMPIQHNLLLSTVPTLGIQFANDCNWLAREAHQFSKQNVVISSSLGWKETWIQIENQSRQLAITCRSNQTAAQKFALMECLDEANGFREVTEPSQLANCERALKQVHHTLQRLSQAWQPIMLRSEYLTSIGNLIDSVLKRVLLEIEDLQDIGEVESSQLNQLCKSLHTLDTFFRNDLGEVQVGKFVPIWFKFSFLSELLEASMADIMWMHQEGMLWEYTPIEITNLMRALFAASTLRAQNIDIILGQGS